MPHDEAAVNALMAHQHGLISYKQARNCGLDKQAIAWRIRKRRWIQQDVCVYQSATYLPSWHSRILGACLRYPAIASHRSAGWIWGLEGINRPRPSVVARIGVRQDHESVHVRTSSQFDSIDVVERQGIPTTDLLRTLIDLGHIISYQQFEAAVDDGLRRGLVTWEGLLATYRRLGSRGRTGSAYLRRLLEERFGDDEIPLSLFSRVVSRLLVENQLPTPTFEYRVAVRGSRPFLQVDLAYPAHRLAIECQSVRFHLGREPFERDARRMSALVAADWRVIPVTWEMCRDEPKQVVAVVRSALNLGQITESEIFQPPA